jgi:hypothetical protein
MINKLNIDFDQWDKLNECTYLIFSSGSFLFIGYINQNKLYLINAHIKEYYELRFIKNVKYLNNDTPIYYTNGYSYYKNIKNKYNNIIIVGKDIDKNQIIKNHEKYNCNKIINL